jgi:hypothetical protein
MQRRLRIALYFPVAIVFAISNVSVLRAQVAPDRSKFDGVTIDRGVTHDDAFARSQQDNGRAEGQRKLQSAMENVAGAMSALSGRLHDLRTKATAVADDLHVKGTPSLPRDRDGSSSSAGELAMIAIQSLISQRQQALQMTTQLVQSIDQDMNAVLKNIGGGGGGGGCKTCMPLIATATDTARGTELRAVNDALAALRIVAQEEALNERDAIGPLLIAARKIRNAGAGSPPEMSEDSYRTFVGSLDMETQAFLVVLGQAASTGAGWNDLIATLANSGASKSKLRDAFDGMMVAQFLLSQDATSAGAAYYSASLGIVSQNALFMESQSSQALSRELDVLKQRLADYLSAAAILANRIADLNSQLSAAEKACELAMQAAAVAIAAATAAGEAGGAIDGASTGFAVGGPIGAVVGAVAGEQAGQSAAQLAANEALAIAKKFCGDIQALLEQLLVSEAELSAMNKRIAEIEGEIAQTQAALAKAREAERLQDSIPQKTPQSIVKSTKGKSDSALSGRNLTGSAINAGTSPCGSARNPCASPGRAIIAPGLLEGDSGSAAQGPRATGAPAQNMGPGGGNNARIR